jgi:hypothetical protein
MSDRIKENWHMSIDHKTRLQPGEHVKMYHTGFKNKTLLKTDLYVDVGLTLSNPYLVMQHQVFYVPVVRGSPHSVSNTPGSVSTTAATICWAGVMKYATQAHWFDTSDNMRSSTNVFSTALTLVVDEHENPTAAGVPADNVI